MKLGISTYTYNWSIGIAGYTAPDNPMDIKSLLRRTKELDLGVLQICDSMKLNMLSDAELDTIREYAQSLGVELEIGTSGIYPEHLYSFLRVAKRLQVKFIRVLLHDCQSQPTIDEAIIWLKQVIPKFAANKIVLGIENHDKQKCEELIYIIKTVDNPYLGICLDTANSYGTQEPTEYVLKKLLPYAVNFHFKNFIIERSLTNLGFHVIGAPANRGEVDFAHILTMINQAGKDINIILELWTPFKDSIEQSIELEEKWAFDSILYMKDIIKNTRI